ncbi:conjugal transfer relaxosome DNA-binding protein TraM [Enterobacter asburiae]
MGRVQVYVSDEVSEKINAIISKRRAEGARDKDVSYSSVSGMLLELGLRVYEAQTERKENPFNQMLFNKTLLENVLKSQAAIARILAMDSLSPHIVDDKRFVYAQLVTTIKAEVQEQLITLFPEEEL